MAEHLEVSQGDKKAKYELLLRQVEAIAEGETDIIALMANVASMIHHTFGFLWTGFYRVQDAMLILGPFQGPLACTRIPRGRGVCGSAWAEGRTLVVPDVEAFPGHIACSSQSRSEIVVPICCNGNIVAVLDIDSTETDKFDAVDAEWLERIVSVFDSEVFAECYKKFN